MTIDMTYERQLELAAIEYKEAGRAEGRAEAKVKLIATMQKKVHKNKSLEQIADELEEDIEDISPIYDAIVANKDKIAEEIYSTIYASKNS